MKEELILKEKSTGREIIIPRDRVIYYSLFDAISQLVFVTKRMATIYVADMSELDEIDSEKEIIRQSIRKIEGVINRCLATETIGICKTEKLKVKNLKENVFIVPNLQFGEITCRLEAIGRGYDEIGQDLDYEEINQVAVDITKIENALTNIETLVIEKLKNKLNSQS